MPIWAAWPGRTWDACADFFGTALRAAQPALDPASCVLELGCAEFDFLTLASRCWPTMTFTGLDWRARPTPPGVTVRRGDVLQKDLWPPASFNWIVAISTIEHIGLGHYEHDPIHPRGDASAMAQAWHWLSPGGWLYVDVPWTRDGSFETVGTRYRLYNDAAILTRLLSACPGYRLHWTGTATTQTPHRLGEAPRKGDPLWMRGFWLQKPLTTSVASRKVIARRGPSGRGVPAASTLRALSAGPCRSARGDTDVSFV